MTKTEDSSTSFRPPIVAVLGHVDHGKTTLLDTIRKTNVTASEAGGITQHIGAYQIKLKTQSFDRLSIDPERSRTGQSSKLKAEEAEQAITFIDTPGHEAFAKMRSRGANVADIALLVVAATERVMPQTKESIEHIKKANIPMIVVLNKTDLPEADPEKIKRELAAENVLVEGYGGDVVAVPVSAKTGKGIKELLDVIILVAQMKDIKASTQAPFSGIIIESRHDRHRGALSTVIVKQGTLKVGETIYAENTRARVRALTDDLGQQVKAALPGTPVEIMGWEALPTVGSPVTSTLETTQEVEVQRPAPKPFSLPPLESTKKLRLILKADTNGSLEAITGSFGEGVEIVEVATGEINESDILLAKSTGAFVIGFHVKVNSAAQKLATVEKVKVKVYRIIYELFNEISEVVELLNVPEAQEQLLGEAQIVAEFKAGDERVAGCKIVEGRIAKGDLIKVLRSEKEIGRTKIKSMRQGKVDIAKVEKNAECGLVLDKKLDFKLGDRIIAYKMHELLA